MAAVLLVVGALSGCNRGEKGASQTAAKVNKEEITVHQINFALEQQRGIRSDQLEAASRRVLERLIDQELAVQRAEELKLDRDPRVVQQIEAVKREVLARAYMEKISADAPKPTEAESQKYYDDNPLLFKDRHVYSLQELTIEAQPAQVADLRSHLESSKNFGEFVDYLKANDFKFGGNQVVRSAEQIPMQMLAGLNQMKPGQAVLNASATGAQVLLMAGSRSQPVDFARARPAIEQFIVADRRRQIVANDIKQLRASAKVQYMGKFAQGAPSAASAADVGDPAASAPVIEAPPVAAPVPAPAPAPAPEPAASAATMDSSTINKGLGIK